MRESLIIYYTDDNVDGPAIRIARHRGVQIITSIDAALLGEPDETHFQYAVQHGYVLVTGNEDDFRPLYTRLLAAGEEHPGVMFILPRHLKNSTLIADELQLWYEVGTPDDMKNQMVWI